jgi:UDP-3-O-[3-hydroxymyristoyl] glucosamine N-acyltransferase
MPTFTAAKIAELVGGELDGPGDIAIAGINSMAEAEADQLTFISSKRYAARWPDCRAAATLVSRGLTVNGHDPVRRAIIWVDDAELATAKVLEAYMPPAVWPEVGVHPSAFVHPEARIAASARIGPHVSIDRLAEIGENVTLMSGVRIYAEAKIGNETVIHANSVIRERCRIGSRVILNQTVSIGADGFGYRPEQDRSGLAKMPHVGTVIVEDGVEIGAGSCVDRAKFGATIIGQGTKIDNLVQIAHNCRIGRNCVIAGQAGMAGSVTVGDWVQIGAQVGIADGLTIGDGARIGARSGVMDNIPPGVSVLGEPAVPARQALRQVAAIRKLSSQINDAGRGKSP